MDYVSIRVSTLRGDQKIDFNAYIKINDKMVLYLRRGDSFEGERLKRLKDKKLRKMFILNDEESKYRDYLQKNIEMAYDERSGKDINARAEIVQGQQQSNTEEVFEDPGNVESYNNTKDAAGKYVQFLMSNSKAISAVMNISNDDCNIAHHGVTVSTLSVALAQKLNVTDPKKTQLLALGALLHDFGHYESGVALNRLTSSFTKEEMNIYTGHADLGAQKVQDKKHFDQTVINIIAQHEECIDGSGFPKGVRENQIDPLAVIVSSANALDRMITFEKMPRQDAVKKLMIDQVGRHPLNHIQFLGDILKNT
ncbi:HD-GYP domain-containing protein [Bdellovibrio sp. HCB337]|uniref:HD-GYP domain-containing protein n=1 Tax=Bdellovibrio sp. HCB337 TaxID=3394358 RepID=UPI0039A5DA74